MSRTNSKRRSVSRRRRPGPPVLEVADLKIHRGTATLLNEFNWRVEAGEHWAVLGPNGSGKTSLLKALTGYLSPTAGEFAVLGRRYGHTDWRELRLKVGVVTSAFASAIPPAETALETAISGKYAQLDLWKRGTRADPDAALACLEQVGARRIADRAWIYLSQGERQRVLIARALMARPKLLILDEPCAGLDPVAREDFLSLIGRLARRRTPAAPAMILVTHHVEEIMPVFTHALLLRGGRVVAAGETATTLTSRNLSVTFGARIALSRRGGRYRLALRPA